MIPKQTIEQIIGHQEEQKQNKKETLPRKHFTFSEKNSHAMIISGIRRCGKSTLLGQIKSQLQGNSLSINFEDPRLSGFDASDFLRFDEIVKEKKVEILLFDEIQNVKQWENYIRYKLDEGFSIFITGSNAALLSKELGTKLTGRNLQTELFPFSYLEFCLFTEQPKGTQSLQDYIVKGGFPEYLLSLNEEILMRLFNDIVIRDVAVRYNIRNHIVLQQLAVYLISNTGKLISANGLKKLFNINSSTTVLEYLSFLQDCYLLQFIHKFSYSLKVQQFNQKKVYAIDSGLINTVSTSFTSDMGRKFENLVFIELRRQFQKIFYFSEKKECDFIVFKNNKINDIIQACYELTTENLDREISGIVEAMIFFNLKTGTIITFNQKDEFKVDDKIITAIPFFEWAKH